MTDANETDISRFIQAVRDGDATAKDWLFSAVYEQLRALASSFFAEQRAGHTLQPTALVHEAYLRLADKTNPWWNDRTHFFRVAAKAMRQLLTDHARRGAAIKRGGNRARITLNEQLSPAPDCSIDLFDLDGALTKLQAFNNRLAKIVELRYLAGLTVDETAAVLELSPRTVKLDWQMARAWLKRELDGAS